MSFSGKVVVVTGASSGIGAAIAVLFAKEGAKVALVGRNEAKLSNTAKLCTEQGSQPLVIEADLSKDEEAGTIIKKTVEHFGRLDILVNNAGISKASTLLGGDFLESYDALMATNVRAAIFVTSLAAPYLVETKGNIVNISSIASVTVPKRYPTAAYSISKAAMDHFTRCAALELAPKGVRVNSVNPGPVRTDIANANASNPELFWDTYKMLTALGRLAEPEEIADLVLFLASDKAKSITGCAYVLDNGCMLKV